MKTESNQFGRKNWRKRKSVNQIVQQDIDTAVENFLQKGGKIEKLPPQADSEFMRLNRFPRNEYLIPFGH